MELKIASANTTELDLHVSPELNYCLRVKLLPPELNYYLLHAC